VPKLVLCFIELNVLAVSGPRTDTAIRPRIHDGFGTNHVALLISGTDRLIFLVVRRGSRNIDLIFH
jgi:hypothetical protein